jgi:circadian clock protein KaiC
MKDTNKQIAKLLTFIPGLDLISLGGLPARRTTLVAGTPGSGKSIFAAQFLAHGIINNNESGVLVTFEESPASIRDNMRGFGWDIEQWEKEGKWLFVDASPDPEQESVIVGSYDFAALLARLELAVRTIGATRLAIDSLAAIFNEFPESKILRKELFRVAYATKKMGLTSVMTSERTEESKIQTIHGIEEFVSDNVIILRNSLEEEKRRRTIEIFKFRGAQHQKGEFPYSIMPDQGIVVIPLSGMSLDQKSTQVRIASGSDELDKMCGGGFFRDSIILVSGATGTGKTLLVAEFVAGGLSKGEKCLLFAFEESREQLFRNASGWGIDFEKSEQEGNLKVVCAYPEVMGIEEHLLIMKEMIEEFKPDRIAVDSFSALERVATDKAFREFVIGLTAFIKHKEAAGLFTSTTPTLLGGTSVTEAHISTITDSIILLRYVEMRGEMRRGLTVLKMRGSMHDKDIREYTIDSNGMHIGRAFRNVTGILSGMPSELPEEEMARLGGIFKSGD